MDPLTFRAVEEYRVTPEDLWPLIADTNRLNRAIGLQSVDFSFSPREDGGSVATGEFRRLGITVARWTEHPFEFERPRRYRVVRDYSLGPVLRVATGVELVPTDGGTRLEVHAEITPRNAIGWFLARYVVGPRANARLLEQCRIFEEYLAGRAPDPFPQLQAARGAVDDRRLNELIDRLDEQDADPVVTARLRDYLRTAPDDAVGQMRPFQLADTWGTDRHGTLITFLWATTLGVLDMRWEVLCPHCRAPSAEYASLSDLDHRARCEKCNAAYDANFDRLVEVRFRVSPSIRRSTVAVFCIGGPQNMPHIAAQATVAPGRTVDWSVQLEHPVYRLRSPQSAGSALIDVHRDAPEPAPEDRSPAHPEAVEGRVVRQAHHERVPDPATFVLEAGGMQPAQARLAAGLASIRLESRLRGPAKVVLEQQLWPEDAVTAAVVSTLQEFRDLFSSEVLAAGVEVAIERLALIFTDLAGSTEMYERIGQARAFRLVHDQFRLIEAAVRANHGAAVKTIGDAVMAVFPTTSPAVRAAIQMERSFVHLDTPEGVDPTRLLKVGIHVGPCMAVTLNDRLDYFGTAVNMTARVEHEARGGEIVLTEAVWQDPGVADVLEAEGLTGEACEVLLRGITRPVGIVRITGAATTA